ncbi:type VII secretion protein EccCa [Mycolicibacterium komossense]|uniref:type VII secretion protein EccCa n=1 Tax=Mycolicibacterium komossense TaxID=1779 RepID=UPI0021F28DF5|nr:type VII secretion protein EccCa [Mycolicibacterium komossense]
MNEIAVAAPPPVPRSGGAGTLVRLLMPAVTLLAGLGMVAAVVMSGASIPRNPMFALFPIMMVGSAVVSAIQGGSRQRAAELDADRTRYLEHLRGLAATFVDSALAQREWLWARHPAPDALWTFVGGPRMWERQRGDADFGRVRIGVGAVAAETVPIGPESEPDDRADPVTWTALRRFLLAYSTVASTPVTIALPETPVVTIDGESSDARSLVRAMVCQLTVLHSPADLVVLAAVDARAADHWDWLKWLPHHRHPSVVDEVGSLRLVYPSLAAALAACPLGRCAVVIADGVESGEAPAGEVTVLRIGPGDAVEPGLRVTPTQLIVTGPDGAVDVARPDLLSPEDAVVCARRLAGHRPGPGDVPATGGGWRELVGASAVGQDWKSLWANVDQYRLRVPLGTTPDGAALELDIREAAHGGMGPHGLCVGATGSGKSELLRTIALGMIARHPPEALNLVLIDFKGGATFLGLDRANHVSAVITNLADEAYLVDRMRDALTGEINRRQQILRSAGNLASITEYERSRRAGRPGAPLPALFIIVDEFSELLAQQPEFLDVFVAIARLGRSLGMHLLLASQRLDDGRLRGLDAHLSYRICLKTLSAGESRMTIGVPDAYELPGAPGAAYLKIAAAEPIRFQAAYVSGPTASPPAASQLVPVTVPTVFTAAPVGRIVAPAHPDERAGPASSVADIVLAGLVGYGASAHRIWLPPLVESPALTAVLAEPRDGGDLTVPVGLVDNAFDQRRSALALELSGAAGNVAVVGGPQSGKSTLLRTLVTGLAVQYDPGRITFYCLDFGGGGLACLQDLPHVGAVAGRHDPDLARRTVAEIAAVLRGRQYAATSDRPDGYGEVFLAVDGWHAVRQDADGLEQAITAIAAEGLSHGVHVVMTAARWADIRPALKDQLGTRIELRLGDPADSEVDRTRARAVPAGRPGHGLAPGGLPFVAAVPPDPAAVAELLRSRHGDRCAPAIRLLPGRVDYDGLLGEAAVTDSSAMLLGIGESRLAPVTVDLARAHLVILGDPGSGKTTALRVLCREILRTTTPLEAQVILVDPRRTLLDEVAFDRLAGYLATPAAVLAQLPAMTSLLRDRIPDATVSQHQLRGRTWWTGPDIYLVVDDYDLVATAGANPLAPILEVLPHAADIGLHMVIARRHAGAARALYEPVLAAVRDLGAVGLQLSGSPEEGAVLGAVRARPLPPGRGTLSTGAAPEQVVQVAWTASR